MFSLGATQSASRVIDFLALKMGLKTFEAEAVDAYYLVLEHEEVVVEPAKEYLERLAKAGRDNGHGVSIAASAARETRSGSELGGTRGWNSWSSEKMVAQELHMDDIHGATPSGRDNLSKIWHWRSTSRR